MQQALFDIDLFANVNLYEMVKRIVEGINDNDRVGCAAEHNRARTIKTRLVGSLASWKNVPCGTHA